MTPKKIADEHFLRVKKAAAKWASCKALRLYGVRHIVFNVNMYLRKHSYVFRETLYRFYCLNSAKDTVNLLKHSSACKKFKNYSKKNKIQKRFINKLKYSIRLIMEISRQICIHALIGFYLGARGDHNGNIHQPKIHKSTREASVFSRPLCCAVGASQFA